ncbi:MAG TPA: DUF5676 family membrane protein [Patescibacteria group bacterium]|nr:DUF5676 family membrane protein [Patescibacteria group bacterium]
MIDTKAFANAGAIVGLLSYSICLLVVLVFPELVYILLDYVFHGLNLELLKPTKESIDIGKAIIGSLILTAYIWVTLFSFGYVYNRLKK